MVPIAGSSILYSAAMTWQYSGERPGGRLLLMRLIGALFGVPSVAGYRRTRVAPVLRRADALLGLSQRDDVMDYHDRMHRVRVVRRGRDYDVAMAQPARWRLLPWDGSPPAGSA